MKLKCKDGVVRRFNISSFNDNFNIFTEGKCLECGKEFGVHDTGILKPKFKEHICKINNEVLKLKKKK
jgi:hypothetical protein